MEEQKNNNQERELQELQQRIIQHGLDQLERDCRAFGTSEKIQRYREAARRLRELLLVTHQSR